MLDLADPGNGSFYAQTESGMRDRAVSSQIQIPLISLARKVEFFDLLFKKLYVMDALAASDELSIGF